MFHQQECFPMEAVKEETSLEMTKEILRGNMFGEGFGEEIRALCGQAPARE